MKLQALVGVTGLLCAISCFADLRPQSAAQLCTTLNDTQLRAGEWIVDEDGQGRCSSGPRPIKTAKNGDNTIAYAVEGRGDAPSRVKLTLNVVVPSDDDGAKRELIRATKRLSVRALGLSIPHSFDEAIFKAKPITLEVGSGRATLARTVVDKRRYLLSVIME